MKKILLIAVAAVALLYGASVWSLAQPFSGEKSFTLAIRADPARAERIVKTLAEEYPRRHPGNGEKLYGAATFLERELADAGLEPMREAFSVRGAEVFNLFSQLGPQEGARVVVGAHYDSHPATPGADDNASGVAAALEVARILRATPPGCPVEVALYTTEEPPYFRTKDMGSAHHVARWKDEGAKVRAMFSLDMIGYFRDEAGSQGFPPGFVARPLYSGVGNFVFLLGDDRSTALTRRLKAAFAGTSAVPIASLNVPQSYPTADFSDHLNFWAAGHVGFMVSDSAFMRNGNYHRDTDVPATLDYRRLAAAADGVAAMVLEACASE